MGGTGGVGHMAPPGSAWLPKHSCHFVLLKVGLLTGVGKGNGAGGEGGWRGQGRAADYFKGVCRLHGCSFLHGCQPLRRFPTDAAKRRLAAVAPRQSRSSWNPGGHATAAEIKRGDLRCSNLLTDTKSAHAAASPAHCSASHAPTAAKRG